MSKTMAEKRKWRPKTCTRKNKKRQMKVWQTDEHLLGKNKKKQQSKDKQIDDRDWAGLHDYLIEIIIGKLPVVDCLSFGCVCKPWKSTTTKLFKRSSRGIPLLVKPGQIDNITRSCINVLDQKKNSTFDIPMPEEYIGSYIWGSYHDWLFFGRLLENDFEEDHMLCVLITLLNPFSGEKVVLPKIFDDYHMLVLSSVPSDPKCIYMLVSRYFGAAFWTSGAREWHDCSFLTFEKVIDALYHGGHFYLLGHNYKIGILDETRVRDGILNMDCRIAPQVLGLKMPCFEWTHNTRRCLVESSGDILLMCRIFYCDGPQKGTTCGFETFRMDVSQREWVKFESLGDKVIFLGKSCSRSFLAKEELGDHALANNIYFSNNNFINGVNQWKFTNKVNQWKFTSQFLARHNVDDVDDWGVYRLHSEESDWPRAFRNLGKHWAGFWVTAPIWWCSRQQTLKQH